jgi:glycosyltransferase involved in cell wall biosynthesis
MPGVEAENISPDSDPRFQRIVERIRKPLSGATDVHVRHYWPPDFNPPAEGRWVMIQPWEYGRLPAAWVEPMSTLVDEVWVYSRHLQKTYIASGVPSDLVKIVPAGVNSAQFHPAAPKYNINSEKKFKFLFVGVAIWRKGIDLLLDAYRQTFSSKDDVVLIIKDLPANVFYVDQGAGKIIRQMQNDPGAPEIVHIEKPLETQEIPGLYSACDCLVHPYRAEGFALPVIEAMACGTPVITTAGGSTDDFCSPDGAFLIPAERVEFKPSDIELASGGGWVLEPDFQVLKDHMVRVFNHEEEAKQRAVAISGDIRRRYDWQTVAGTVIERIHQLSQKPVRRRI